MQRKKVCKDRSACVFANKITKMEETGNSADLKRLKEREKRNSMGKEWKRKIKR